MAHLVGHRVFYQFPRERELWITVLDIQNSPPLLSGSDCVVHGLVGWIISMISSCPPRPAIGALSLAILVIKLVASTPSRRI
jgi:hypothetical protein